VYVDGIISNIIKDNQGAIKRYESAVKSATGDIKIQAQNIAIVNLLASVVDHSDMCTLPELTALARILTDSHRDHTRRPKQHVIDYGISKLVPYGVFTTKDGHSYIRTGLSKVNPKRLYRAS
jgi:hypothetical protein